MKPAKTVVWMIVSVLMILLVPVLAGASSLLGSDDEMYKPEHDHMVQFGLERGPSLSWAHRMGDSSYLRYGLRFSATDSDTEDGYELSDTSYTLNRDYVRTSTTLYVDWIKPVMTSERARLYVGAGPYIGYQYYELSQERQYSQMDTPTTDHTTDHRYSLGARALAGGEYALSSRVSLFVETSFYAEWDRVDSFRDISVPEYSSIFDAYQYVESDRTNDHTQWSAGLSAVTLGVSFRY